MANRIGMAVDFGTQLLRVGWFYGVNQLVDRETRRMGGHRAYQPTRPVPTRAQLFGSLRDLMVADAQAVRDGIIPPTEVDPTGLGPHVRRLRAMMRDLPAAVGRRAASDAATARAQPEANDLPDYFTQDFHFQTGGYLTDDSAKIYDVQVETLFYGSGQLMRRAGLRAVAEAMRGRDQRHISLLDVACGTGRLLREIRRPFPAMRLTGCDLSQAYLNEAEDHLSGLRGAQFVQANAETLPFDTGSQDIVTCVFLFHELPPNVRRTVASEMARVLKPGGTLVFVDSLQMGDKPDWDGLLEAFPVRFHEPYYRQYSIDDLDAVFSGAGLEPVETRLAFLSKVMVWKKGV